MFILSVWDHLSSCFQQPHSKYIHLPCIPYLRSSSDCISCRVACKSSGTWGQIPYLKLIRQLKQTRVNQSSQCNVTIYFIIWKLIVNCTIPRALVSFLCHLTTQKLHPKLLICGKSYQSLHVQCLLCHWLTNLIRSLINTFSNCDQGAWLLLSHPDGALHASVSGLRASHTGLGVTCQDKTVGILDPAMEIPFTGQINK